MPPLLTITYQFFLQIVVILATYRLLWPLFRRLGQVQVVAIMVAGFLLGPSVLGAIWPQAQHWLFPTKLTIGTETVTHPNLIAIYVVGQLGLVLYMFLVGASFKLDILGAHTRQAGATSAAGIGVPLVLGGVLGWWMVDSGGYFTDKVAHWQGGLFVAAAVAITAFPMLAWIVYDSGLLNTRLGTMSLSCAAVDDACSWVLLATVVATAKGSVFGAVIAVGGGLLYLLFMIYLGRPLLARLDTWTPHRDSERTGGLPIAKLSIVLLVLLTASWFTDLVGIYSVFGAFVAGLMMPRGEFLDRRPVEVCVGLWRRLSAALELLDERVAARARLLAGKQHAEDLRGRELVVERAELRARREELEVLADGPRDLRPLLVGEADSREFLGLGDG